MIVYVNQFYPHLRPPSKKEMTVIEVHKNAYQKRLHANNKD